MKMTREGSENNPRFKLMEAGITIKDIEKWFGRETAQELIRYCGEKDMEIDRVAADDREWDKFEAWAKSKKRGLGRNAKKFDNWKAASRMDDKDIPTRRATKVYDRPADSDLYGESGSRMNESDIINWIFEEMRDCEWVDDIESPDEGSFEISTPEDVFKVSVQKIWSNRGAERFGA